MKSIGENRVRIDFNVSKDSTVDEIKRRSADLINLVDNEKEYNTTAVSPSVQVPTAHPEKMRLIALAQTAYEEAAMWAVKAATWTAE